MSPNKRRMIVSDVSDKDEDSFKHRRCSLKVNLSYCTNLTDSGNGSLGRTKAEDDERKMDKTQINRRLSRSKHPSNANDKALKAIDKKIKCAENDDSKISLQIKEGIQLKHLTINLEDINAKEQTLNTNCKRLKDAILNKTKEIFDKQDELSVKTAMVLANQEDSKNNTHNLSVDKSTNQHFENKKSLICNQYTNTVNNQQTEDEYSNIDATPRNCEKHRNSKKAANRSKLTPKRLFAEQGKKQRCKIIEDIILDKRFSLFPLKQVDQSSSPILSGSNRRLQLLRPQLKLSSQNQSEIHNNVHPDNSINVGQPITCSTFIEDNVKYEGGNKNSYDEARQQSNITRRTINTLVSMELTEIHSGQLRKKHSPSPRRDSCNSIINTKEEKSDNKNKQQKKSIMSAQRLDINSPFNKLTLQDSTTPSDIANNSNVTGACVNTTIIFMQPAPVEEIALITKKHDVLQIQEQNNETKKQNEQQYILNCSNSNSVRSSLNVNTSLDAVTETSNEKNVEQLNDYRTRTNNEKSIVFDNQRESTNINCTSLQVNTSMDSVCKTWQKKSNCLNEQSPIKDQDNIHATNPPNVDNQNSSIVEDIKSNDVDSLENISLIERLRNISMWNQVSYNNKLKILETENEERTKDVGFNNVINAKFQSGNCANNNSGNSHSYVEGTPYPISRSVLFKRQLRHKTQNSDNNVSSCSNSSNSANNQESNTTFKLNDLKPLVSNKTGVPTKASKKIEDHMIILEDTLNCNPFLNQEKPTVIEDTLNKIELETNEGNTVVLQNMEYVTTRRGKRKLLPLNENSQLCSIEPLEEHSDTSEKSMPVKRNKKKLKKKPKKSLKKKIEDSKNDVSSVKDNITNEQVSLDDDCDIFESKKKENKKTRKPKKIVSKKIVIKKFVNENVSSMTEENRPNKEDQSKSMENRDSSNDFVAHRTIPIQWNRYKSQKIVIVTTGLSKGDKSLVKNIVKSLGMAEMELNVSRRTTHVVSTGVRTLNLLRGIIRGCWLITLEWVLKSLESNMWLNPEEFEMKHFSKAVLENRKDRQLFGLAYIPELFTACGLIYVEHKTTLPCDTLKELIKTAGGHITENPKFARITVGANGLKETWVLDSITTGELQSTKLYQKKG